MIVSIIAILVLGIILNDDTGEGTFEACLICIRLDVDEDGEGACPAPEDVTPAEICATIPDATQNIKEHTDGTAPRQSTGDGNHPGPGLPGAASPEKEPREKA